MKKDAVLSACENYRYALWRIWDEQLPRVLFIGLNPSTADAEKDDPTIRRCISYARQWGYGGISVANLFAYRATYPSDLFIAPDPIGPQNDQWISELAAQACISVAFWGNHGAFSDRHLAVRSLLPSLHCLRLTKQGQPHHTRGLPDGIQPIEMA